MALKTEHKLYIALGVLAVLGGLVYVQSEQKKEEAQRLSAEGRSAALPKIDIKEEQAKKVDRIEVAQPPGDAGPGERVVLQKQGEEWQVVEPIQAKANDSNVKSLIENISKLEVKEEISPGTEQYEKYGVSDQKALHAVFFSGKEKIGDLYFGESGGRGQMTRVAGKDGVYAVSGYSSWLYKRDLKGWRDREILKFDDKKVKTVELVNENGTFGFTKDGDKWVGKVKGSKAPAPKDIERFDPAKVDDLLRAYKALTADDFGDDKKPADVGLEKPAATLTITLDDGAKRVVTVGDNSEGENRWVKRGDAEQIFSISSWAANWATAKVDKFQKADEKKGDKKEVAADTPPAMEMPDLPE